MVWAYFIPDLNIFAETRSGGPATVPSPCTKVRLDKLVSGLEQLPLCWPAFGCLLESQSLVYCDLGVLFRGRVATGEPSQGYRLHGTALVHRPLGPGYLQKTQP
jgi:hypothetical protein